MPVENGSVRLPPNPVASSLGAPVGSSKVLPPNPVSKQLGAAAVKQPVFHATPAELAPGDPRRVAHLNMIAHGISTAVNAAPFAAELKKMSLTPEELQSVNQQLTELSRANSKAQLHDLTHTVLPGIANVGLGLVGTDTHHVGYAFEHPLARLENKGAFATKPGEPVGGLDFPFIPGGPLKALAGEDIMKTARSVKGLSTALRQAPVSADHAATLERLHGAVVDLHAAKASKLAPNIKAAKAEVKAAMVNEKVARKSGDIFTAPHTIPAERVNANLKSRMNPANAERVPENPKTLHPTGHVQFGGPASPEEWIKRVEGHLTPQEQDAWAHWYQRVPPVFHEAFGADAPLVLKAWAATQQSISPADGLNKVMDILDQLKRGESPALKMHVRAISDVFKGTPLEKEIGAKLSDFVDAVQQRSTRTWMGHHPEGGAPAPGDVWAGRDYGFVDQKVASRLEQMGFKQGRDFNVDWGGTLQGPRYEAVQRWYQGITDHLNAVKFHGRADWTPEQTQALGWGTIQRVYHDEPQDALGMIQRNTRSLEVPGTAAPDLAKVVEKYNGYPTAVGDGVVHAVMSEGQAGRAAQELADSSGRVVRRISRSAPSRGRVHVIEGTGTLSSSELTALRDAGYNRIYERGGDGFTALADKGNRRVDPGAAASAVGDKLVRQERVEVFDHTPAGHGAGHRGPDSGAAGGRAPDLRFRHVNLTGGGRVIATTPEGEHAGQLTYSALGNGQHEVQMVRVPEELRRQKIATSLFDRANEHLNGTLLHQTDASLLSPEGAAFAKAHALQPSTLDSLNPTGSVFSKYAPASRADAALGGNLTTLDRTMGVDPKSEVTIYRGAPTHQSEIVPGDFVTTNPQLARDYGGTGHVISMKVPAGHVLDDASAPLGEEYIYRPPVNGLLPGLKNAAGAVHSALANESGSVGLGAFMPREIVRTPEQVQAHLDEAAARARAEGHGNHPGSRGNPPLVERGVATPETGGELGQKIREALPHAPAVRAAQKEGYSEERAARVLAATEAAQKAGGGLAGHIAAKRHLAEALPREFFGHWKDLTPADLHQIGLVVDKAPLQFFERTHVMDSIQNAIERGVAPTEGDQKLIERVFGKVAGDAVAEQRLSGFWDKFVSLTNVPRALRSSGDISAGLRQGLVVLVTHPGVFQRQWVKMIKEFGSEEFYRAQMAAIHEDPMYPLMVKGKVPFTEIGGAVKGEEEAFVGAQAAEHIPLGVGKVVRMSDRAFTGFQNGVRAELFKLYLEKAAALGHDVNDDHLLESMGRVVGTFTGRGTVPKALEGHLTTLNALMFSPRLMASRLNLMSPAYYYRLDPFARREALAGARNVVAAIGTTMLVAKLAGAQVNFDPRSSNFSKIKIGNTRIDIAGGFSQYVRFAAQEITRQEISSAGNRTRIGWGQNDNSDLSNITKLFRSKAAPIPSIAWDEGSGKDFIGRPVKQGHELWSNAPFVLQDSRDAYQQSGSKAVVIAAFLSAIGLGVQSYKDKPAGANSGGGGDGYGGGSSYGDGGGYGGTTGGYGP